MEIIDLKNWTLSDSCNLKTNELESIIRQMAVIPAQIERLEKEERADNASEIVLLRETYAAVLLKLNSKNLPPFISGKYEFEKRLHLLPVQIGNDLKNGRLQLIDHHIYTVRLILAEYSELMQNSAVASPGICNISNRKLEVNQFFLLTGISLIELRVNKQGLITNRIVSPSNLIADGEFSIAIGSKEILSHISGQVFREGYYKLDNPKIIPPITEIKPEIWFERIDKPIAIRIVLHGVILAKN